MKWKVLETEISPLTFNSAYLAQVGAMVTTSIACRQEDAQTLHEAAHALNHFDSLRNLLIEAGEHLVRSNYAGGLLGRIDKALADSKA